MRLRQTFADAHRRYTGVIHARHKWTGHLWQGRLSSTAMDGRHFMAAVAYVALNPERARLAQRAEDWAWSSTRALLAGRRRSISYSVTAIRHRNPPRRHLRARARC